MEAPVLPQAATTPDQPSLDSTSEVGSHAATASTNSNQQQAPVVAATAGAGEAAPELVPTMRQRCFSETTPEATLHFQILDLGRQVYVWASAGSASMTNMHLAIKTHMDSVPSCSSLLPFTASGNSANIAQRLALKVGRPVLCSWNIPASSQLLEVVAERRLLQELKDMQLIAPAST